MISKKDFEFKQLVFVVAKDGQKIALKNDNIIIKDKDEKVIHQSTCYRIFALFVIGHISITSALMQAAKKYGFAIVLLTATFRPYCYLCTNGEGNTMLRKKQYSYDSIGAAKEITRNKIMNQIGQLKGIRKKSITQQEAIRNISRRLESIDECETISEIMGNEGYASRLYFEAYFDNIEWNGRKPRIKHDMANSLLDIGYTLLFSFIESLLSIYGFDLYCGVLHRQFYMRKSLVCDLIEPFRVIIEQCVKKGINLCQFKEEDFLIVDSKWQLKYEKSAAYSSVFIKEILDHKVEMFQYVHEWYVHFMKGDIDSFCPTWEV